MNKAQVELWYDAVWLAFEEVHKATRGRWADWNEAEDFFLSWLRGLNEERSGR